MKLSYSPCTQKSFWDQHLLVHKSVSPWSDQNKDVKKCECETVMDMISQDLSVLSQAKQADVLSEQAFHKDLHLFPS